MLFITRGKVNQRDIFQTITSKFSSHHGGAPSCNVLITAPCDQSAENALCIDHKELNTNSKKLDKSGKIYVLSSFKFFQIVCRAAAGHLGPLSIAALWCPPKKTHTNRSISLNIRNIFLLSMLQAKKPRAI